MHETKKQLKITWQGINIDISYDPDYSKAFREVYGQPMAHVEIRAKGRKRLPFTETGYRSHFIHASSIEEHGGPETFVFKWLDHAAQSKDWKRHVEDSKQLSLF